MELEPDQKNGSGQKGRLQAAPATLQKSRIRNKTRIIQHAKSGSASSSHIHFNCDYLQLRDFSKAELETHIQLPAQMAQSASIR